MPQRPTLKSLAALTTKTRALIAELDGMGRTLETQLNDALDRSWQLGKTLGAVKALVGHGNWLMWLTGNTQLTPRHAQRHLELAASNPEAKTWRDLSPDSVRKFRLGYVPDKERPQLEGDITIPRVCHHLTLVNDFRRLHRRIEIGQAELDKEEARRDLAPVFEWLCRLYDVRPPTVRTGSGAGDAVSEVVEISQK